MLMYKVEPTQPHPPPNKVISHFNQLDVSLFILYFHNSLFSSGEGGVDDGDFELILEEEESDEEMDEDLS